MADADKPNPVGFDAAALALASRLVESARWDGQDVTWQTPHAEPAGEGVAWRLGDATPWLYDGLAGIARSLAHGAVAVRSHAPALAGAMQHTSAHAIRCALEACGARDTHTPSGLYDGAMGVACVAVELGRLWRDPTLEGAGIAVCLQHVAHDEVPARDQADQSATDDLISGGAGLVCGAAWIAGWTRQAAVREALHRAASRLPVRPGMGPGLAHGLAGVAVAMAHALRLTGERRFLLALREAACAENAWFDARVGAWADVRPGDGQARYPVWWCHGTTGIALARHRIRLLTGESSADMHMARAFVRQAASTGCVPGTTDLPWTDWSLCHGAAGGVALLLTGDDGMDAAGDQALARRMLADGARQAAAADGCWRGGLGVEAHQPGLMTGEAGILLVMLRAAAGERRSAWPLWL